MTTTAREARCIGDLAKQLDAVCQAAIEFDQCKRLEVMTAIGRSFSPEFISNPKGGHDDGRS
jgi:hypothetical protein